MQCSHEVGIRALSRSASEVLEVDGDGETKHRLSEAASGVVIGIDHL